MTAETDRRVAALVVAEFEKEAAAMLWDGYLKTMGRCVEDLLHGYRQLLVMVNPEVGAKEPGGGSFEPKAPINLDAVDLVRQVDGVIDGLVPTARGVLRLGLWNDRHPNRARRTLDAITWLGESLRDIYEVDPVTGERITDALWEQRGEVGRLTRNGGRSYRSGHVCPACKEAAVVIDPTRGRAKCVACGYRDGMGLKEWAARGPIAAFDTITLHKERITKAEGFGKDERQLDGVVARIERGAELESRVTATRLVALGVFALAAKKKTGGEVFLTIEGPEFFWTVEVDRKKASDAQTFVGKVNDAAKKVTTA